MHPAIKGGIFKLAGVDAAMSLTNTSVKNAKPLPDKPFKLQDDRGMYLLVNKNGSKYFRYNYRFDGKRKTLALGVYPDISLKEAREKRDIAKKQISEGIDPCANKKAVKAEKAESAVNSFEVIAREWGAKLLIKWAEKSWRPVKTKPGHVLRK